MSELNLCVGELRNVAQTLNEVADYLMVLFSGAGEEPEAAQSPTELPVPKPKPITLEQVRMVLAEKSRDGHTVEVRALLERHGATKLSEVAPSEYTALLAEAEVLGNE